jgi:hypothetical protein
MPSPRSSTGWDVSPSGNWSKVERLRRKLGDLNVLCVVVMRALGSRLVAAVTVCPLPGGCCMSMQRAAEINDELHQQNVARAEPAMLSAAQRQGATLLPDQPLRLSTSSAGGRYPRWGRDSL